MISRHYGYVLISDSHLGFFITSTNHMEPDLFNFDLGHFHMWPLSEHSYQNPCDFYVTLDRPSSQVRAVESLVERRIGAINPKWALGLAAWTYPNVLIIRRKRPLQRRSTASACSCILHCAQQCQIWFGYVGQASGEAEGKRWNVFWIRRKARKWSGKWTNSTKSSNCLV